MSSNLFDDTPKTLKDLGVNKTASSILAELDIKAMEELRLKQDRMTIATAAMQGMLASPNLSMDENIDTPKDIAMVATAYANALLEELNK